MKTALKFKAAIHILCPTCGGDGVLQAPHVQGHDLRLLRKIAMKGLNDTAAKMQISNSYLCDLEHGRRPWSKELEQRFRKAIA